MIRTERALELLINILENTDEEMYPETIEIVENSVIPEGELILEPVYELAKELMEADPTKVMAQETADFLAETLIGEIRDGNYDAATDLGSLYYTGRIGVQDYTEAVRYYTIAADNGEPTAQENLGYCYYYGRNVEKDYEKAFHYFALGAFMGRIASVYKIGDMYRNGYFIEKNEREAFALYEKCLFDLDENTMGLYGADIMLRMGDCLFEGIGTAIDYAGALGFYQKAEMLFYHRLQEGDFMIKKNYEKSIERQKAAREGMQKNIPDFEWTK